MASTPILITGGAGFIGSHLARRLQRDGHSVVILDNLLPQVHGEDPRPNLPDCETIWADVRDAEALARALKGAEVVYHFAAETGVGQSQYEVGRYVSVNTYGTALMLETAAAAGVRQIVLASSRAVYGEGSFHCPRCNQVFTTGSRRAKSMDQGQWEISCPLCGNAAVPLPMSEDTPTRPASIYGVTKLQQEQLASTVSDVHNLPVTVLRFFNVYGPGQSLHNPYVGVLGTFFRRASRGEAVEVYEDGAMSRDFVFVSDVVEALQLVMGNDRAFGQVLNVGTGQAITLLEVASEMFRAVSKTPNIQVSGRYRLGDIRHAVASVRRLEETLGFAPRTTFVEGLQQFVEWATANYADAADDVAEDQLAARALLRKARV
jgi:dTDP-L-rhamnose 4-epimerase